MSEHSTASPQAHPRRPIQQAQPQSADVADASDATGEETAPKRNWWKLAALWSMPAWLVSLLFHFLGLTALVVATINPPPLPETLNLLAASDEPLEELEEMVVEFEPEIEPEMEVEMEAPDMLSESFELTALTPDAAMMSESISVESLMPSKPADFAGMDPNGLMADLDGMGAEVGKMAKFFGTKAEGQRICFVVDNSASMTSGRMETALVELDKAIDSLSAKQKFYIVFYSDTAYPLFYPTPAMEMVNANDKNKKLVRDWLSTVQMCWRTDGRDAITLALNLKPDLIYILGDGAFTDKADIELANTSLKGITIHTMGMQVKKQDRDKFAAIAQAHGGTYKDVGITDEGKQLMKMNGPIPRNQKRNGIWGIKLK
ncbi:hypothetical protein Pan97_31270 [Bremerella volcania]|uniref:VWFA domain-containing protein n=1 Tax=Bremerella volcania TaxID=2527984 RepID=A0A518CA43_9BACT|nr:vWA domain-containing protein [Bremerella volcania]QDU76082.1 hypothetical protein Pan97_31270 [Bremerella volcania]